MVNQTRVLWSLPTLLETRLKRLHIFPMESFNILIKSALTSVSEQPRPDSPQVTFSRNSLNINFILASSSFSSSILALFIHDGLLFVLLLWTMTPLRTCNSSSAGP